MLDSKLLRNEIELTAKQLARRGYALDIEQINHLEAQRKALQVQTQELQNERNTRSKNIGRVKASGQDIQPLLDEIAGLGDALKQAEAQLENLQQQLTHIQLNIPNIPHHTTPTGNSEADNIEIRRWGNPRSFTFEPRDHIDLSEEGGLDFEAGVKLTGARFTVIHGQLARLHRAIIQFMLDLHSREHGYQEVYVPYMVNADSLRGTGQLPKFETDLFKISGELNYYLIPTAEVPITNFYRDEMLSHDTLTIKLCGYSACFRREAGSYGKDTRGFLRVHEFNKVELVKFAKPETSYDELESLVIDVEEILQALHIPYRVLLLCDGDTSFSSAKTYDLEAWSPCEQKWLEVSSCSNFENFQARRANIRYKEPNGKPEFVHTLNGSGLATSRLMVAILEHYQTEDGHIRVPEVLRPYTRFDMI